MLFHRQVSPGAPQETVVALEDVHKGIGQIGRLVLLCALVLLVSAMLLIGTALQIMASIDHADLDSERLRAANAIDAMVAESGPLSDASTERLGAFASLRDAHLSGTISTEPGQQQIPLVGGLGPSGSFLTWTRTPMGQHIFFQFAPIRLPIMAIMLLTVLGLLLRLRSVVGDIERQRRVARHQSRYDVVTGLGNRLAFETTLETLTLGTAPFALILFDLDRFKPINDVFGHAAGDQVLQAVGARLSGLLAPDETLARIGGDEFAMLSRSRHDKAALTALAHHCIAAIHSPIQLVNQPVRVGISFGIVTSDTPHTSSASLMSQADAALYRAKSIKGSAFQFAGAPDSAPVALPALIAV